MPSIGTLPNGQLAWIDANGNVVNPDGSPAPGGGTATPLAPTQSSTGPLGGQVLPPAKPTPAIDIAPGSQAAPAAATVGAAATGNTAGAAGATGGGGGNAQTAGQPPAPVPGIAGQPGGDAQVDSLTLQSRTALGKAYDDATKAYGAYQDLQQQYAKAIDPAQGGNPEGAAAQQLSAQLVRAQDTVIQANQGVSTANASYGQTLTTALQRTTVDPALADKYTKDAAAAQSQAGYYDAQSQVLKDGSSSQIQKTLADMGLANANASAALATAAATTAKTPDEKAALQAQASLANAQANQITTLLPDLKAKAAADTTLTQHQVGLTDSQSTAYLATAARDQATADLTKAQTAAQNVLIPGMPAAQAATTAQAAGAGAASQASAQATLEGIKQAQQGALYGLGDRVKAIQAIQQQVFGPGGSGDPNEANDMLKQYVDTQVAGTTPYAAGVAAANAGLTQFGTQASLSNEAGAAAAQRAQALSSFGGSVIGSLGAMNANAPKGSTALAGAVQNVIDYMANKMTTGAMGAPTQPQAPPLPAILQKLAGLQGQGNPAQATGQGSMGGALGAAGAMPAAPSGNQFTPQPGGAVPGGPSTPQDFAAPTPTPSMAAPAMPSSPTLTAPSGNTSAPVTINIGGQSSPGQTPGQNNAASTPMNVAAMPGAGPGGAQSTQLPASLQQYAPPTTDFVHQLWSKELGAGAVQSPYAAMSQQIAGPTPMAA